MTRPATSSVLIIIGNKHRLHFIYLIWLWYLYTYVSRQFSCGVIEHFFCSVLFERENCFWYANNNLDSHFIFGFYENYDDDDWYAERAPEDEAIIKDLQIFSTNLSRYVSSYKCGLNLNRKSKQRVKWLEDLIGVLCFTFLWYNH